MARTYRGATLGDGAEMMTEWPDMPPQNLVEDLVTRVHATPHMTVLAYAGAGSQALAWLHGVGGSSRTVMAAVDIYHEQSMRWLLGFMPSRFTSRRVARQMAGAAHELARDFRRRARRDGATARAAGTGATVKPKAAEFAHVPGESTPPVPVFGLGSAATIATDRTKRGDHRVACAVEDGLGSVIYALTMEKGARDRDGEEELVSLVILGAVADACGVFGAPPLPLTDAESLTVDYRPSELIAGVSDGSRALAVLGEDGHVTNGANLGPRTLLSGSFNPVHDGHLNLARVAAQQSGLPVLFELPLLNAAKAPIDPAEARKRALQFAGRAPVAITTTPLFAQKAELFPGSVFVVGSDTAERVLDSRFYDGDEDKMHAAMRVVQDRGCRFLVAGRRSDNGYKTLADIQVPECYEGLFEAIPEEAFRDDISSTQIRQSWATEWQGS